MLTIKKQLGLQKEKSGRKYRYCFIKCHCGVERPMREKNAIKAKSCGCEKVILFKKRVTTHRGSSTRIYRIWRGMKSRCSNSNLIEYKNYGGRGIKICKRWEKYENFRDDMISTYKDNLMLDRINNNGNYSKENCRWTDRKTQQNNTRRCRKITFKGRTQNLAQWSKELGIHRNTLDTRFSKWGTLDREEAQEALKNMKKIVQ